MPQKTGLILPILTDKTAERRGSRRSQQVFLT
jgi:hypothetical protein